MEPHQTVSAMPVTTKSVSLTSTGTTMASTVPIPSRPGGKFIALVLTKQWKLVYVHVGANLR